MKGKVVALVCLLLVEEWITGGLLWQVAMGALIALGVL